MTNETTMDRDEFRWFEVKVESFSVYAESRDDVDAICKKIDELGSRRFKHGQQAPCLELVVTDVLEAE